MPLLRALRVGKNNGSSSGGSSGVTRGDLIGYIRWENDGYRRGKGAGLRDLSVGESDY